MRLIDRLFRRGSGRPMSCSDVGRVLQSVLDAETDDEVATRVAEHLEACRDCGLEADTYLRIKVSLANESTLDSAAAARLRSFGSALVGGTAGGGDADDDGAGP